MPAPKTNMLVVTSNAAAPRVVRWAYAAAGGLALTLGTVGIVVPGWPTTVFWLVSAWCFSRSCPVLQRWIYTRPVVGPAIADLLEHRRLSRANKRRALVGVWLGLGLSAALLISFGAPPAVGLLFLVIATGVSAWLHYGFRPAV